MVYLDIGAILCENVRWVVHNLQDAGEMPSNLDEEAGESKLAASASVTSQRDTSSRDSLS